MFKRNLVVALFALCLASPVAAESTPLFGPETFPLTVGGMEVFEEAFESASAGEHMLYVRNGADDEARVASAEIDLNGRPVLHVGMLDAETAEVERVVRLVAGVNDLRVTLKGEPGAFVTVVLATRGTEPVFVAGRLVLPWGRVDDGHALALALRNDSRHAPRAFRVLFFGPGGALVAASDPHPLPPRGSAAFDVEQLMQSGAWSHGSLEVIYTGPGRGRMLGSARQVFPLPVPHGDTQHLIQAGFGVADAPRPRFDFLRR